MSDYSQPAAWGDTSMALGMPVLVQTAAPHLRTGERLLGAFALHLDQLLPLFNTPGQSSLFVFRGSYRLIRRLFHGAPWSGYDSDSTAYAFWKAVRNTPQIGTMPDLDRFVMVLTDQRMILLTIDENEFKLTQPYRAKVLLELPRGTYRLRPQGRSSTLTHRFDVDFSDGSWIALMVNWTSKKYDAQSVETLRQVTGLLAG